MRKYDEELIKAIKDNKLVLFVGAGMGMSSKIINNKNEPISDWKNLVRQLLENLKTIGNSKSSEKFIALSSLVEKISPIDILYIIEKIKNENGDNNVIDNKIKDFLLDFFALHTTNNYTEHQKLWKLSKKIITTNFDKALENSFNLIPNNRSALKVCYDTNASLLRSWFNLDDYTLLKIHGCIDNPDTLIIFPSEYNSLYSRRQDGENINEVKPSDKQQILFHFQNIITNYTILFLGYSMNDIDINNIFGRIKRMLGNHPKKHFIISPNEKLEEKFSFLRRIPVDDNFEELPKIIRELLIRKHGSPDFQRIRKDLDKIETELEAKKSELSTIDNDLEKIKKQIELLSLELYKNGLEDHKNGRYVGAIRNFEIADKIQSDKSNNSYIFNSWANLLVDLAKMEEDESHSMNESFEKYRIATEMNEKNDTAFVDWGNALYELANRVKTDKEVYLQDSFGKYKKAIEVNDNNDKAFYSWVIAIIYLSETNNSKRLQDYFHENLKEYKHYKESIQPIENSKHYLKALCYAYIGDKIEALENLQKALDNNEIEIDTITNTEVWEKQFKNVDIKTHDEENYNKYMKLTNR